MENIKKPSIFLHLTEIFRAIYEKIFAYFFLEKLENRNIGNGQAILVLPGLLSHDRTTKYLRVYMQKLGFNAYPWEQGINLGHLEKLDEIERKLQNIHKSTQQKTILLGWSMGGIMAREMAKKRPDLVKSVITLGSPFASILSPNWAKWVYNLFNDESKLDPNFVAQISVAPNMPTVAFYSKLDGIVPWQACKDAVEDDLHQNVEVKSSHIGMGTNAEVLKVLGEKLAYLVSV